MCNLREIDPFVLRGEHGDALGVVLGSWLRVTYLRVADVARGAGHGTRFMKEAES